VVAALETLAALEGVHQAGYIHRDVKPANFAQTQGSAASTTGGDWRIIDFGIARRFVDDAGRPLPKREDFGEFRGSTTYASIHAHLKQDLGAQLLLCHYPLACLPLGAPKYTQTPIQSFLLPLP
jgi:serine/threonine protein kinase